MEQQNSRFKDLPWFTEGEPPFVIIGGAGGIGSYLTFFLARAGFDIAVYDFDLLEAHNLGGQFYGYKQIGKPKVDALKDIIRDMCSKEIYIFNSAITEDSMSGPYMFGAFDNMIARKAMFNSWKKGLENGGKKPILIDGRINAEMLQIFCVTPENMDKYEKEHLFDDSDVEDEPCTMKQTSHIAGMIATLMTGFFTNHIANINLGEDIREVPFFCEYFIPANLTETNA